MRKLPRAGQTIYDNHGCPVHLITCKRVAQEFVCEVWYKRKRETIHLKDGKIIRPGYNDLLLKSVPDLGFGLVRWDHNKRKALNKGFLRIRQRLAKMKPMFITAKAPREVGDNVYDEKFPNGTMFPDWYGVPQFPQRANDLPEGLPNWLTDSSASLKASCCAIADTVIMVNVPVKVIDDPNNPENNGRELSMLMPKSRIDAIKKLTEGTK